MSARSSLTSIDNLLAQAAAVIEDNYDPANPAVRPVLDLLLSVSAAAARLPSTDEPAHAAVCKVAGSAVPEPDSPHGDRTPEEVDVTAGHRLPSWAPSMSCTR